MMNAEIASEMTKSRSQTESTGHACEGVAPPGLAELSVGGSTEIVGSGILFPIIRIAASN